MAERHVDRQRVARARAEWIQQALAAPTGLPEVVAVGEERMWQIFDRGFTNAVYQERELRRPVPPKEGLPEHRRQEMIAEKEGAFRETLGEDGLGGEATKRILEAVNVIFDDSAPEAWEELARISASVSDEPPGEWMHEISTRLAPEYFVLLATHDEPLQRLQRMRYFAEAVTAVPVQTSRLREKLPLLALRYCIGYRKLDDEMNNVIPDQMRESFQALTHPMLAGHVDEITGSSFRSIALQRAIHQDPQAVLAWTEQPAEGLTVFLSTWLREHPGIKDEELQNIRAYERAFATLLDKTPSNTHGQRVGDGLTVYPACGADFMPAHALKQ